MSIGTKVELMGAPGSGKTHALRTLVDAGIEPCVLFTDNGMDVMKDLRHASTKYKEALAAHKVHWHYVPPAQTKWSDFKAAFDQSAAFDIGTLQKMPATDKRAFPQFGTLLQTCEKFVCDECKADLGNVDSWGTDRALVLDGLSGTNSMLLSWAAGSKPAVSQPEWGQAMKMQLAFVERVTLGLVCHTIILTHLDREIDLTVGSVKLMPLALGAKNAPQLGKYFTDIILAERVADTSGNMNWKWHLARVDADVKARNLDWKNNQEPSFVPLIETWRKANV
jgi:hypothetical protein